MDDIFKPKQKYIFQICVTNLKTAKGKELVKQYKIDVDTQPFGVIYLHT